jgi:hypothetical protein
MHKTCPKVEPAFILFLKDCISVSKPPMLKLWKVKPLVVAETFYKFVEVIVWLRVS